jgi:hypothetical protein
VVVPGEIRAGNHIVSSSAFRCGPWLPKNSSSIPDGLGPMFASFSPLQPRLFRLLHGLPLFLLPCTVAVAICQAFFGFVLFRHDLPSTSEGFYKFWQYLSLAICPLSHCLFFCTVKFLGNGALCDTLSIKKKRLFLLIFHLSRSFTYPHMFYFQIFWVRSFLP